MDSELKARLVPLEGGYNFRDLGGYQTADGRKVRWRRIYRSGLMSRLSEAAHAELAARGIRTIVDFRTGHEQVEEPTHFASEPGVDYWSRQHEESFGELLTMVRRGIGSVEEAREIMTNGYRNLPFQQGVAYAEMFRRIAAGGVPLVFHCTAGKDRTGGAAALVLAALGVPRETIAADFHMTERAGDLRALMLARPSPSHSAYANIGPEVGAAIGGARPEWILAMLDELDSRCGGVEGYLADMGFTPADLRAVREELLESGQ